MKDSTRSFVITKDQIQDVYKTLKNLSDSYVQKGPEISDSEWLSSQYRSFFPNLTEKEAMELGNATVNGVQRFDSVLKDAMQSASAGKSKEQWFSEKMKNEIKEMDIAEAGNMIQTLDSALLKGNQMMAESTPIKIQDGAVSIEYPQLSEQQPESETQWNSFTVKDILLHMGQNAALTGLQTMNQSPVLFHTSEMLLEDGDNTNKSLKTLIESGDTEQVKSLLTAAIKIGIDSNKLPFLSKAASVDTIASIASNGVEYASTLSQFSSGKITLMQALEHVGLSGVSLLYSICSIDGIRAISTALLSQIPIIGPVVGNIVGSIISVSLGKEIQEKVHKAVKKVENVVRNTVHQAWNTIKSVGQKIKSKVKSFCRWLFA